MRILGVSGVFRSGLGPLCLYDVGACGRVHIDGFLPLLLLLLIFASYNHGCGVRNSSSMDDLSKEVLFVGALRRKG